MFTASWQSELYAPSHFSDSDEPDSDDDNPFLRNAAFKRAKARQMANARRKARERAMFAVRTMGKAGRGKGRPQSAAAPTTSSKLPTVSGRSSGAKDGDGDSNDAQQPQDSGGDEAEDALLDRQVLEATGSPRRKLDRDAARRIQKYIEAESPALRREINDTISRPTDLIA